jgi:hypothetical protein
MEFKIVLLPGNSVKNEEWIDKVNTAVEVDFAKTYVQHYKHWETGAGMIDFEEEAGRLQEAVGDWENFVVFGKSAGVILAMESAEKGLFNPKGFVFAGFPYKFAQRLKKDPAALLKQCNLPTHIIQQSKDPAMYYQELKEKIDEIGNEKVSIERIPGQSHHYGDIAMLRKKINAFVEKRVKS